MKLLRTFSKRYCFRKVTLYLVVCCLFFSISPLTTLAGPKGKALGHSKLHGNSHSNLHSISVLTPINTKVNPAGVIVGTGGAKTNQIGSNGYLAMSSGEKVLFAQPGSNIFVEIDSLVVNKLGVKKVKNNGEIHISGQVLVLAAGDAFSGAFADLGSLASSLTVPEPIGAKGPNPVHGGQHLKKGDGNPGGGNGNGHWGKGNKGNGVGNIWTGNQGRGVGEGMAGGSRPDPDPEPEPEPESTDDATPAPVAPLAQFEVPRIEGCPKLTQAAAMELGITAETIQVGIGNALALNPTIQPCGACAALVDAATILRDEGGSQMAAMIQVFNELAPADAPFTPEMATSIVTAFAGHVDDGTYYATAIEYIDAFIQYIAVLDTEMGSPVGEGDSVAFVMEKYGAGITGSDNGNIAAFVATRIEGLETFGD